MNDEFLEEQLRQLKPGVLPDDLRDRLREEPEVVQPVRGGRRVLLAVAAGLVVTAGAVFVINRSEPEPGVAEVERPLSVVREDSVLLSSRTVETREHEGQLWELVEQKWRDDLVGVCSATPVKVRSTTIRPELVWVAVQLY